MPETSSHTRSENDRLANPFAAMSNALSEELSDESCLHALVERMRALQANCLADLQGGLQELAGDAEQLEQLVSQFTLSAV